MKKLILIAPLSVIAIACAQRSTKVAAPINETVGRELHAQSNYKPDPHYGELKVVYNKQVQTWINYFTGRGRRHMKRYLSRSTRYMPIMKEIMRERGMPEELVYLQFVESGFSSSAYSHAAAVGYWQFIRGTGKRYNLKIDGYTDERQDPILSTQAAASYFDSLYNLFGDWYLAMASYNWGENRVKRAVMRHKTRDYFELSRRRKMPAETRNYVPKLMASILIAKDPKKYGFTDVDYAPTFSFDAVSISKPVSLHKLANKLGVPYKEMKRLNPRYRTDYVPIYRDRKTSVRVPKGMKLAAQAVIPQVHASKPKIYAKGTFSYRVRRGDTLSQIAAKHGTSTRRLMALNNLSRRSLLRIGQRLRVPQYGSRYLKKTRSTAKTSRHKGPYHTVRRGETLSEIAEKYNIGLSRLRRLNQLGRRSMIRVGQKLKLPSKTPVVNNSDKGAFRRPAVHKVRRGDNLSSIAAKYGMNIGDIKRLNKLGRRSKIYPGQKLQLKAKKRVPTQVAKKHTVRRGENLSQIAAKYGVSVGRLAEVNQLKNRSKIYAGKRLVIP